MTRREVAEKVFKYIRENKFEPVNIRYGDSYFIFDKGEDGVVYFSIKGLNGWKFGMWVNTNSKELQGADGEEYPALSFFCQHELNIDKFKPSRSFFCAEYDLYRVESESPHVFFEIIDMLKMIKRHPFVAFAMDCDGSTYYDGSYVRCYTSQKWYRVQKKFTEWWNDTTTRIWHGSKVWFIKKYKVVDSVKLIDGNEGGWKIYPRYTMKIHFRKISDDVETQQEAEIKMLDLWFRKDSYKNVYLILTRDGVEGRYGYAMVDGDVNKLIKNIIGKIKNKLNALSKKGR